MGRREDRDAAMQLMKHEKFKEALEIFQNLLSDDTADRSLFYNPCS